MKKIILVITAIIAATLSMKAQNANQSGFFMDFSSGYIIGDSPITFISPVVSEIVGNQYVKEVSFEYISFITLQLSGGYRWAFATNWALEGKVGVFWATSHNDNFIFKIGPGLRYTSKELGNSNSSLYFGLNPNVGMFSWYEKLFTFGYEVHAGVNISNSFSIGLIWNAHFLRDLFYEDDIDRYGLTDISKRDCVHTGSIGVNFEYRF